MIVLDRTSSIALSDQIENQLRQMVKNRVLPGGAKLMSIRRLATQLAVSPNTVVVAYDRLVAASVIVSHGTSGFFVCSTSDAVRAAADEVALEAGEEQEAVWLSQQANDLRADILLASSGALPPTWLQDAVPAATLQRALAHSSAGMASRCPSQGLPELREQIAHLLRGIGIAAEAGHVLTTYGGMHAIDMICASFLQAGDTVLVEDPGYFLMFGRLRQAGIHIIPIRRQPDGIDLDQLDIACRKHRPRLFFLQTALHNPTGWSSSAANLHRVLMLAQKYNFLIAEDDVHGHFQQNHATRLASLSGLDGVIYYSSFCKAVSPALRLGYIAAAPSLLKILLRTKIYSVMTTPALNEYVLLEVLKTGNLRKHLDRLQRKIMTARNASIRQLSDAGVAFEQPGDAGIFLWGTMPAGLDVDLLVQDAYRNKILLMRGAVFSANDTPNRHIRFNVAFCQHPRLSSYLQERLQTVAETRVHLARVSDLSKTG
jgi:DNA-binding transcriptional MocR family regulator